MDLVIARFSENLDWLQDLCQKKLIDRIFVYNKGGPLSLPPLNIPVSVEQRPNVGLDIETYLNHIFKCYNDLGDYTLFLQGTPQRHTANLISKLLAFKMHPSLQSKLFIFSDWIAYDTEQNNPRWAIVYRYLFYGTAIDMTYGSGAQYLVSNGAIRFRSQAFYAHALDLFKNAEKVIGLPGVGINTDAKPGISAVDLMAYPFEGIMPIMWDLTTKARK